MAEIDENSASRASGNRRRGAGAARERANSWLQVDEEANRIVIDVAAARRGGRRDDGANRPAGAPARGPQARPAANVGGRRQAPPKATSQAPAETDQPRLESFEPTADEPQVTNAFAVERPLQTDNVYAGIPTLPLEPAPQEFGRDLDADVHIPAEQGSPRRRRKQGRKAKPVANPFGRIDAGEKPKGRARVPTWQKILMGVCGLAIAGILFVVLGTGTTKLPGYDQGVLVRNEISFLDQNLNLRYAPQSVTWQLLTDEKQLTYGPARNRLIAVMLFTPEQAADLMTGALPMPQPDDHQAIETERWFPEDALDLMDDVDSDTIIYDASVFYDGVFQRGYMIRLGDSGYIVLKLFDY
jgi:hypothetical protein